MTTLSLQLFAWVSEMGLIAFALFLRVGASMALLPAFGEQVVPMRVRLGLTIAFCTLLLPLVAPEVQISIATEWNYFRAGAEIANGFLIGFAFRLFVIALNIAGMIAASATSLAQIFGGGVGVDPQPAIANIMVIAGLALATMGGLHLKIVEAFLISYDLLPAGDWPNPADVVEWAMRDIADAFGLGFAIAGPFAVAALVYNLALGVINRAMPQLMVAFVGAPALTLGGLMLLAVSLPFALEIWVALFEVRLIDPLGSFR